MIINTTFDNFKQKHKRKKNQVLFIKQDCKDKKIIENIINNFLDKKTLEIALALSEGPTLAFGRTKELVHKSFDSSLEGQMELETVMISKSTETLDGKEGIKSFVNKEKPNFLGK